MRTTVDLPSDLHAQAIARDTDRSLSETVAFLSHRQVTGAYLAHLARSYSARLAPFDQALAKLHADVADLIPVA